MKSLFLAAWAAIGLSAADGAISGQWKLYSNIQGHETNLECTLTQTGKELTGSCKSSELDLRITGSVEEKKVTLQYKTPYQGQELTVIHTGTMESAGKIAGSVDVQPLDVPGDFTLSR